MGRKNLSNQVRGHKGSNEVKVRDRRELISGNVPDISKFSVPDFSKSWFPVPGSEVPVPVDLW